MLAQNVQRDDATDANNAESLSLYWQEIRALACIFGSRKTHCNDEFQVKTLNPNPLKLKPKTLILNPKPLKVNPKPRQPLNQNPKPKP